MFSVGSHKILKVFKYYLSTFQVIKKVFKYFLEKVFKYFLEKVFKWYLVFKVKYLVMKRTTPQSSSGCYHYERSRLLRGPVGRYRRTDLDAGADPEGWKAEAPFGRRALPCCLARSLIRPL